MKKQEKKKKEQFNDTQTHKANVMCQFGTYTAMVRLI